MFIVDLTQKEVSAWFEIEGGGRVHLRLRNMNDEKEIRDATTKNVVEYPLLDGKYQRFETTTTDYELYLKMAWEKNIIGWDEIVDINGIPIPVNNENKVLLMKLVPKFRDAVDNGLKSLNSDETAKVGQSEKN